MSCREKILSEEYLELLLDYTVPPELAQEEGIDYCIVPVEGEFSVLYLRARLPMEGEDMRFAYYAIPKCYGLMQEAGGGPGTFDPLPLLHSGISQVQREPLSLTGRNVVLGIIDTGVRYTDEVFRDSSGQSRILSIWDQTIQTGEAPEGFHYGSVYTNADINAALDTENPRELVPSWDEDGHGTSMASVAAGSVLGNGLRFQGAAPDARLVVVKLRQAKADLRRYYQIPPGTPAYSEADIMLAVKYVSQFAITFLQPVVVCLGLGSSSGSHTGDSVLDRYLDMVGARRSRVAVACGGNEGDAAHHYEGEQSDGPVEVELRVGEGENGFLLEFWGEVPNLYTASLYAPGGERVEGITGRTGQTETYRFIFEPARVTVNYLRMEQSSGRSLILFHFFDPSPGIWTISIEAIGSARGGRFHMWLPIRQFLSPNTYFLRPSPEVTLTVPSLTEGVITVSAYNDANNSFYARSGRGYAADGHIKPDLAAPGVEISTVLGKRSGTSYAAALTAGAAAQFMQWAAVEMNYPLADSREVKNFLILGAKREDGREYPNREWGYGRLDIQGVFERLAEIG